MLRYEGYEKQSPTQQFNITKIENNIFRFIWNKSLRIVISRQMQNLFLFPGSKLP